MKLFPLIASLNLFIVLTFGAEVCKIPNNRPIIGVLSQEYHDSHHSYIAASYVKYLESAGARVVPILIDQNEEYYKRIVNNTNGLLFPGGGQDLINSGYGKAGKYLWDSAIHLNDNGTHYPIWGTCLGFELLTVLKANQKNWLTNCHSEDVAMNLKFDELNLKSSNLFRVGQSTGIVDILRINNVTANYHSKCLTPDNFTRSNLSEFFNILTTNEDAGNKSLIFISTIESKKYPIYGTQWHPEKNQFEFELNSKHKSVPHSYEAVLISQYMANFFVNESRKNCNQFDNLLKESQALIYNYNPIHTGQKPNATFEQIYLFSSANSNLWCVSLNIIQFIILALNYF